jgi:hypothetical protein
MFKASTVKFGKYVAANGCKIMGYGKQQCKKYSLCNETIFLPDGGQHLRQFIKKRNKQVKMKHPEFRLRRLGRHSGNIE